MAGRGQPATLLGRQRECATLDGLLADAREGQSRVIVLRGEAGVGKSTLLDYTSDTARGWRVARAVGIESEMELAYSGLHQICAPLFDVVERLPVEGKLPPWLSGALLRTGPAKYDLERQTLNHWFDGLAMLHRFGFADGQVSYRNRFLQSNSYREDMAAGRLVRGEFASETR